MKTPTAMCAKIFPRAVIFLNIPSGSFVLSKRNYSEDIWIVWTILRRLKCLKITANEKNAGALREKI